MILITGGSGKLGSELKKHLEGFYPTHSELDITNNVELPKDIDLIVHCAAYTDVDLAETQRQKCIEINVLGTYNLLQFKLPFIYISTEHINGNGVYFQSKLIGELLVKNLAPSYLILRTLFKPNPFPWDNAWINQMTQGDYVDVIARLIAKNIKDWDGKSKTVYVGTGRKSMYELALKTKPGITPTLLEDLRRPKDYV